MSQRLLSLPEYMEELYRQLDAEAQQHLKENNAQVSCREGCDHCCKLLATITIADGLTIAEHLMKKPDWPALLPALREAALAQCYPGLTKVNYFEKQIPCVFLKEHRCSIYPVRPPACRFHFALTPPERCSVERKGETVASPNLRPLERAAWQVALDFIKKSDVPRGYISAPLPLMVLYCLYLRAAGEKKYHAKKACKGVPTPLEWLKAYAPLLFDEGGENGDDDPDEKTPLEKEALKRYIASL